MQQKNIEMYLKSLNEEGAKNIIRCLYNDPIKTAEYVRKMVSVWNSVITFPRIDIKWQMGRDLK